jgi:predicted amino acid-binding ACT domain protein
MPGGDKNIRPEDGVRTQFSSTNQPPNRGRKARVFSQLAKEWKERGIEQATPEAVKEAFQYVLALHLLDVKDISGKVEDETNDMPMVVRLAAKELLGKKSLDILREMLDRAHGKSRQNVDVTMQNVTVNDRELTDEQLDAMQQILNGGNADATGNK